MLRCFKEVTQPGSFTIVGKSIGLTQSGISVKIRRLEERLSTPIINRTNKRLSLALEGELLLDYAGRILSVKDEAVSRLTKPKAGRLRIGIIDCFVPELLPNIHLEVQAALGIDLIPLLETGALREGLKNAPSPLDLY